LGRKTMAMIEAGQDVLILKRASASRSSGEWSDDDYDVLAEGAVVGRIFKVNAVPVGSPWMWTLAFGHHKDRTPTHGYAATREAAMAAFAKAGGAPIDDETDIGYSSGFPRWPRRLCSGSRKRFRQSPCASMSILLRLR
jgi:hypothetical protein